MPRGKVRTCSGAGLLVPSVVVRGRVWCACWAFESSRFRFGASRRAEALRLPASRRTQRRPAYVETGSNSTGGRYQSTPNPPTRGTRPQPPTNKLAWWVHSILGGGSGIVVGGEAARPGVPLPFLGFASKPHPPRFVSCWHDVLPCRVGIKQYYK